MNRRQILFVGSLASILAAAACSPHRVTTEPESPIAVPGEFSQASSDPLPDRWWEDFADPELNRLVEATVAGNLQLRAGWARLRQASALATAAGSGRWPQLDFSASASRRKIFNQFSTLDPTGSTPSSFEQNSFGASLAAGYEIDVWKKMSNKAQAAIVDARGARSDVEALAMSLAAEVTEAWFDLRFQIAQGVLLREQTELNSNVLELVELRFQGGLATALEVLQQRQQLIATRSQLINVTGSETILRQRLAVLTGHAPLGDAVAPRAFSTPGARVDSVMPTMPKVPGLGLPADLLVRRPDVRAARDRVIAADYRVAVAVADRLPSLRIGGSLDVQNTSLADLISTPLWSIFANLAAPLFDGHRRKAEVERNRAVLEERLANYGQVLLGAIAEVEGAIVGERQQRLLIKDLEEQLGVANQNLTEARSRYEQGLAQAGFLDVLTALRSQQAVEINLLGARRRVLSSRVSLCRALGGSWTQELSAPPRLELRSQASKRKN